MEVGRIMSISLNLHRAGRAGRRISLHLPSIDLRRLLALGSAGRRNRIDREYLPESLRRDLGLTDGRGPRGCGSEWRAALFSYPPRSL
ncbi:hypothetical protein ACWGPT_16625 [Pseudorhizobium sp. NPDC055634]